MNNMTRLPGAGCRYFRQGRCAYAEMLNPGYHDEHACSVVRRWTERLDDFYDRAEAMGVREERLSALWEASFERMLPEIRACRTFSMGGTPWECINLQDRVCLVALPRCEGRCRHFEIETRKPATRTPENER